MSIPTDEQLNLAMCEWMGWEYRDIRLGDGIQDPPPHSTAWHLNGTATLQYPPDYLSDDSPRRLLNDAEAKLTQSQRSFYYEELKSRCNTEGVHPCSANARQRVITILQAVKPELFQ